MKIISQISIVGLFVLASISGRAQSITTFGSNALYDGDGLTLTWTPLTSVLGGKDTLAELIYGDCTNSNFAGATHISLTAFATSAPTSTFSFLLQDQSGNTATAIFSWLDFAGTSATTKTSVISYSNGFDATKVTDSWNLVCGGSGSSISATLVSASAITVSQIPEPATCAALLGLGVLGMAAYRKRRVAA